MKMMIHQWMNGATHHKSTQGAVASPSAVQLIKPLEGDALPALPSAAQKAAASMDQRPWLGTIVI